MYKVDDPLRSSTSGQRFCGSAVLLADYTAGRRSSRIADSPLRNNVAI